MNSMEEMYGLEFDHGKVRGILTLEKSQKTAAITEQQAEVDFRWGGKALTAVRLTPKTDDWNAGLDLMANKTTEISIQWRRFTQAEYPGDRLADLEKVMDAAQAEGAFPCIVNRPMTSVISAGIGRNSGVIRALVGAPDAPAFVGSLFSVLSAQAQAHALPVGWDQYRWAGDSPVGSGVYKMQHGIFANEAGKPHSEWKLSELTLLAGSALNDKKTHTAVVLVPLQEGGAAPFVAELSNVPDLDVVKKLDSEWEIKNAKDITVTLRYPLKWSITYIQNDVPLASPVKTLVAGAAITHLLDYLEGKQVTPGCHIFKGATPIDICRRVLGYLYRQAIDKYVFNPVDQFWDGDDAKMIQAILDFCYAIDRRTQLQSALAYRPDVLLFMDTILLSGLTKGVKKGQITVPPIDDEFAEWLVDAILSSYRRSFQPANVLQVVKLDMPKGLSEEQKVAWKERFDAIAAKIPAPYSFDYVSTDYVANALITMLKEAIPVILKALRGEWPGISVIQYSESMVDLDVTVSILEALEYALKMDASSVMSKAQFTLPYRSLFWASMYSTFTCRVPRSPVSYGITDLTAGLSKQAQAFAEALSKSSALASATLFSKDKGQLEISSLSSIFQYGGFSYLRYGPDLDMMIKDQLAPGLELPDAVFGDTVQLAEGNTWLTNAPSAHGDVEVSTIIPCWDASAWRVYADMLQSQTLKTYFAVPITKQLCSTRVLSVDVSRLSKWTKKLMQILDLPTGANGVVSPNVEIAYPSFPALFDIALVIPYIREYEHQKLCAQDLDHSMEIELDPANSYWNMSGTILLPEAQPDVPGVTPWRVPSFQAGFAGKRTPAGVYSQPVVFNAQR